MKQRWIYILLIAVIMALIIPGAGAAGADSTLIETFQVKANSPVPKLSVNTLQSGATYLLKVNGTWQDTSVANHYIDAEYTTFDTWQTYVDGTPHWGPPQKDLNVNGADVNWGGYSSSHEYTLIYTGTGAPVSFMIIDKDPSQPIDPTWYADNIGSLTVQIFKLNHAPVLSPIGNRSITEGQTLIFTISASDPDNDTLTYTASNMPSGAIFTPLTKTFTWKPGYNQAGIYQVSFTVSDGLATSSQTVNITVNTFAIMAKIDIDPDTLNLKSKSGENSITAYIELPAGYNVNQINVNSVTMLVNGVLIAAQAKPTSVGDYDRDRIPDRMVKFDRKAVISALGLKTGNIVVVITGQLNNGCDFSGSDTIKVINTGQ
jgi:hypothetical protein